MTDIIIIGVIVACAVLSIAYMRKRKKSGKSSCGHDCSGCGLSCSDRK